MESVLEKLKFVNLYSLFKIKEDASQSEIKAAYRLLIKQNHPDKVQGEAEIEVDKVIAAYSVLSNETLRSEYDHYLGGKQGLDSKRKQFLTDLIKREKQKQEEDELVKAFLKRKRERNRETVAKQLSLEEKFGISGVKVEWRGEKEYSKSTLRSVFSKVGIVEQVILGENRTAFLLFLSRESVFSHFITRSLSE